MQGRFVIDPVVEINSKDKVAAPIKDGFYKVPRGAHELRCKLKAAAIAAKLGFYPSDVGVCMMYGYVSTDSLSVGSNVVTHRLTVFNWRYLDEDILTNVEVAMTGLGLSMTTCTAKSWE